MLMVASGMGSVLTEVLAVTLLQRATPRHVIASVFGILDSLMVCAILVGTLVALPLIHAMGLEESLILVGAVVPLTAVMAAAWLQSASARSAHVNGRLAPNVALLARLPWLEGTPQPALNVLAATASVEAVPAGTRIIEEGATPDDFFVLVSGAAEARCRTPSRNLEDRNVEDRHVEDRHVEDHVATLTAGAGFGEIGLLHNVPRTASVVATEPAELLRISGARFVTTVNALPQSAAVAPGGGLAVRLGAGASEEVLQ